MRRIFIAALGTGTYVPCQYVFQGRRSSPTCYVQSAIVELFGEPAFDRAIVLVTPEAQTKHGETLRGELAARLGDTNVVFRAISSDLADVSQQWRWFEALLDEVEQNDRLVIDLTHGYRAVPIVLSSALGYLQKVKSVELEHVLYGADLAKGTLVDMRDFYVVQEWAEAVGRLVDGADARKLSELARRAQPGSTFERLADPSVADAFRELTDVIRNVDVHSFTRIAGRALGIVTSKLATDEANATERQLLSLVADKFAGLFAADSGDARYTREYLRVQAAAAGLLLDHGLLMQAFTVMRELVGSVGMFGVGHHQSPQVELTRVHADTFVRMCNYKRKKWTFVEKDAPRLALLLPWYEQLDRCELTLPLHQALAKIAELRNGFDHGWTEKAFPAATEAQPDPTAGLQRLGQQLLEQLREVLDRLPDPTPPVAAP